MQFAQHLGRNSFISTDFYGTQLNYLIFFSGTQLIHLVSNSNSPPWLEDQLFLHSRINYILTQGPAGLRWKDQLVKDKRNSRFMTEGPTGSWFEDQLVPDSKIKSLTPNSIRTLNYVHIVPTFQISWTTSTSKFAGTIEHILTILNGTGVHTQWPANIWPSIWSTNWQCPEWRHNPHTRIKSKKQSNQKPSYLFVQQSDITMEMQPRGILISVLRIL